jgi:hypothetical protein
VPEDKELAKCDFERLGSVNSLISKELEKLEREEGKFEVGKFKEEREEVGKFGE